MYDLLCLYALALRGLTKRKLAAATGSARLPARRRSIPRWLYGSSKCRPDARMPCRAVRTMVAKQSGKSHIIVMRYTGYIWLRNAVCHWARVDAQCNPKFLGWVRGTPPTWLVSPMITSQPAAGLLSPVRSPAATDGSPVL